MKIFNAISYLPLFFVLLIIYHIMTMLGVNFGQTEQSLFSIPLPSGAKWQLNPSDIFILVGVITLYIEIIKSTRTGTATIIEHGLSMLVFLAFLMYFLFVESAGTSALLAVTMMSLLDVIAGFTITVASARRDFSMGG